MYYRLAAIVLVASVQGFVPSPVGLQRRTTLFSSAADNFMKLAQDKAANPPAEEEVPKLFDDAILEDMQNCLLALERRVKEGPGSLTHSEVDDFAMAAGRVLQDMKAQGATLDTRVKPGERQAIAEQIASKAAVQAEKDGKTTDEIEKVAKKAFDDALEAMIPPPGSEPGPAAAGSTEPFIDSQGHMVTGDVVASPPEQQAVAAPSPKAAGVGLSRSSEDNLNDEPDYDDAGIGLSRGTANTYVIPGMDEMTPDEYQKALAQTVIERSRRQRSSGTTRGNKFTHDYMASLSGNTAVNVFGQKGDDDDDE